ncbi:MAG: FAD-dependent oxidoreductase [candidate division Zixibacteria bacterium]|nr:FAD-dependent oxidoreductase [candidate division Zixibacteria bacterium]
MAEASRCLGCADAPCIDGCPARNNIVKFIRQIAQENFRGAIRTVKESNVFAGTCAYICPVGESCEMKCGSKLDRPVKIGELQRFVAEYERENGFRKFKTLPPKNKKIGVIGAGPAGLSASFYLVCMGYEVEVFEAAELPGGILTYGIPENRLIPDVVKDEIEFIVQMGAKIKINSPVDDLNKFIDHYDAIFIGVGAYGSVKLKIPGEELEEVIQAQNYLKRRKIAVYNNQKPDIKLGSRVAVFGGGNTAIDAATCAKNDGSEDVKIYYRRSINDMPAFKDEIEYCKTLDIEIIEYMQPVSFQGENNKLKSVTIVKTKPGEVDQSGRQRPVMIEGSEFFIEIDSAIAAIGQLPTFENTDIVDVDKKGLILIDDETMKTSHPKIFAGGDAVNGGATVVKAVADGCKAAEGIDALIGKS